MVKNLDSRSRLRRRVLAYAFLFVVGISFIWIGYFSNKITGKSIISMDVVVEGDYVNGVLNFNLKEGELMPKSSLVQIKNGGQIYDVNVSDFANIDEYSGDYFISDILNEGSGDGYGVIGRITVYPEVDFEMEVEIEDGNDTVKEIVSGVVSKDNDYIYSNDLLVDANIISAKFNGSELDIGELSVDVREGEAIVSTSYFYEKEGFGADYLGEGGASFSLPLKDVAVNLTPGEIVVSIIYNGNELTSISDSILSSDVASSEATADEASSSMTSTDNVEPTNNEKEIASSNVTEEAVEKSVFIDSLDGDLSSMEKDVLKKKLGLIAVKTDIYRIDSGRVIVEFNTKGYSMKKSYSDVGDNFEEVLTRDTLMWLRDIYNSLVEDYNETGEKLNYSFTYSNM